MNSRAKTAFMAEMQQARRHFEAGALDQAFSHLERAHILGQRNTVLHTWSHWWMFRVGLRRGDFREVRGQVARMLASVLFSRIWVPEGNTGGAYVSPLKPMPIPADLRELLQKNKQVRNGWGRCGECGAAYPSPLLAHSSSYCSSWWNVS